MELMRPRRRPGPQPKGERQQFTVRMPVEQFEVYKREAAARGLPVADYLAAALADVHGLPEPDYLQRARRTPRAHAPMLPLTGTG